MDGSTAWIRSLSRWANAAAPTMRTRKPWGWSAGVVAAMEAVEVVMGDLLLAKGNKAFAEEG